MSDEKETAGAAAIAAERARQRWVVDGEVDDTVLVHVAAASGETAE